VRGPGDLAAVEGQSEGSVDLAEQSGSHPDLEVDHLRAIDALRAVRITRIDRGGSGGLLRVPVGAGELGDGVLGLRGVGELVVHRLEVLVSPVVREPLRHVLLGASRGADHAEDEGDHRDDRQRERPLAQPTLAFAEGPALRAGQAGRSLRRPLLPFSSP
jgi:hypothetical protein